MGQCGQHVVVVARDYVELDALGAHRGTFADLSAAAELLGVMLVDHGQRAGAAFGLALRQVAEVGDLGAQEQCRRGVGAATGQ